MPLKENIVAIRKLLTEPDHWCQGRMSQDRYGHYANHSSSNAASWCMMGAISRVMNINQEIRQEFIDLRDFLEMRLPSDVLVKRIEAWNDYENRTHQEVLDFLDEAIASLESKEPKVIKECVLEDA